MKPLVTMREALEDPQLLGGAIPGESWALWRVLLIAAMGEALTDDERVLFHSVTGRSSEPLERVDEIWAIVGRRGGKTRSAGTFAAYLAALCDWSEYLAPGERGALPILAAASYQAGKAFEHVKGILTHSPVLNGMLEGEPTAEKISLDNSTDITIAVANFRTVRSITAIGAICDELAFWSLEGSKNPDQEILRALRPALATTSAPMMVISSPYARKGELFRTFRSDFGPNGDKAVLVANGPSKTFNSTLKQSTVDKAYQRDPGAASAEYGGLFRTDVETLLVREVVEALVDAGITERAREPGISYSAFVDPAGGSGTDSMTLCIAHRDRQNNAVIDVLREKKPPFKPSVVTAEFCETLKSYGVTKVTGDNFGGEWCKEPFSHHGVTYERCDQPKSALYGAMVPHINSGHLTLLDNTRAIDQLVGLERRSGSSGRDIIDHAPGGHDDVANAIAGAVAPLLTKRGPMKISPEALVASASPANPRAFPMGGGSYSQQLIRH
ncbi:hypothetical protein KYK30_32065 [Shinella yambaruensis]|uniref:Terminase n=1 Tax=Shinella yambaruensis TaxID=415996 RepID=A0ABQ5ZTH5_9HYPH|nr:hypothetical protein [Shinella yambaruensis]MCJ8030062.1 hypothetical protein [Shinella yambaruensis]MCU7984363.1 hypothetical protein [Shinella yambaruensis]GLR54341.1 hypothetical protein GCM10007923_55580 [Shinella yambaruensis]